MPTLDPRGPVPIGETWAKTNVARPRGYVPRGARPIGAAPHGHRYATTLVGALTVRGFMAPVVVGGAVDGGVFLAYVEQVLVPGLRSGDVAVMDDPGSRTAAGARAAGEGAGCRLLLRPPYSPDLNPIENAFSDLEGLLRKAAERTVEGLWSALGRLLGGFTRRGCRSYFRHRGYTRNATPT